MLKFGSISSPFLRQLKKLASTAMHVNTISCVLGQRAVPDVMSTELVKVIKEAPDPAIHIITIIYRGYYYNIIAI